MRYIFHISDVHIKNSSYNNIRFSFERLMEHIAPYKDCAVLVIAGDVFENKTFLTTDDIYIFVSMLERLEEEGINTIIVPGNHDFNINSKLLSNNIDILVRRYQYIVCASETCEITIDNVNFGIYSFIDKQVPNTEPDAVNIAILHEQINGARYDNDEVISGARFSVKDLAHWDYVLLGDIHKPQFLADKIAYSGSFVQKNKGEGLQHGYVLWDIEEGHAEHVFIPLVEVYLKIEAADDHCEMPQLLEPQKVRYITLIHQRCSEEYITQLRQEIEEKFGYINKVVDKDIYTALDSVFIGRAGGANCEESEADRRADDAGKDACEESEAEDAKDANDEEGEADRRADAGEGTDAKDTNDASEDDKHEEDTREASKKKNANAVSMEIDTCKLLEELLIVKQTNSELREVILSKHRQFLQDRRLVHHTSYKLNYLYWSNILCYGKDNWIDFRSFHNDIVLLNGNNKTGKSSVIDILIRALFNECYRGHKDDILNKAAEKGRIKLSLNIGAVEYVIEHIIYVKKTLIRLMRDGVNITQDSINNTYKYLREVIGIGDYKDFINMNTALQNRQFLVDMNKKDLLRLFTKLLDIDMLSDLEKHISGEVHINRGLLKETTGEINAFESKVDEDKMKQIREQLKEVRVEIAQLKATQEEHQTHLMELNNRYDNTPIPPDLEQLIANTRGKPPKKTEAAITTKLNELYQQRGAASASLDAAASACDDAAALAPEVKEEYETYLAEHVVQATASLYKELKPCAITMPHNYGGGLPDDAVFDEQMERELNELAIENVQSGARLGHQQLLGAEANIKKSQRGAGVQGELRTALKRSELKKVASDARDSKDIAAAIIPVLPPAEMAKPPYLGEYDSYVRYLQKDRDYDNLKCRIDDLTSKIEKFNATYGSLTFDEKCACCCGNSAALRSLFDVRRETKALNAMLAEYETKKEYDANVVIYKERIAEIEKYLRNEEARKIHESNAKLQLILDARHDLEVIASSKKWARYELLAKCRDNTTLAHNAAILAKIAEIEQVNNTVASYKQKLAAHARYENARVIEALNVEIAKNEKLLQAAKNYKAHKHYTNLLKISKDNEELVAQMDIAKEQLRYATDKLAEDSKTETELIAKLNMQEFSKREAERLKVKRADIQAVMEWMSMYLSCIEHKKGIPSKIVSNACHLLSTRINAILQRITDFTISITYDKEFVIRTIDAGKTIPADMGSGFQKFVLDVIMRIVLINVSVLSHPDMIFIDEGFGCLDRDNFAEVAKILRVLRQNFNAMVVISHLTELQAYTDKSITILRDRACSSLRYGELTEEELILALDEEMKQDTDIVKKARAKVSKVANKQTFTEEQIGRLIEIRGEKYYCHACGAERRYTENAVKKHANANSYISQHQSYLKKLA